MLVKLISILKKWLLQLEHVLYEGEAHSIFVLAFHTRKYILFLDINLGTIKISFSKRWLY